MRRESSRGSPHACRTLPVKPVSRSPRIVQFIVGPHARITPSAQAPR
jgi:hypothetical protein